MGEWEAMKRYIVERARADAVTGENATLRTLAQHVLRAVDEPQQAPAYQDVIKSVFDAP